MSRRKEPQGAASPITQAVLAAVRRAGAAGITSQQLALKLGLKDRSQRYLISDALEDLLDADSIRVGKKGRFISNIARDESEGVISIIASGAGFVRLDGAEGSDDVFVPERHVGTALHGDRVRVRRSGGRGGRPEGRVVSVVKRRRTHFVGVLHKQQGRHILVADDQRMPKPFFVAMNDLGGGVDGDKAILELGEWRDPKDLPRGRVVRVLGKAGEHEVEMHAILAEFGLPLEFPENVLHEADGIPDGRTPGELARRRDMRGITTFTIDPEDAKDLDDALSIQRLDNGNWEVGIHIADVTHYVKANSTLDQEAAARATSVYLVDRVVPMLPERLSNDLCSLNAGTDKLTFSAVFELDQKAHVHTEWFGRTVIHSGRRFAYAEAQALIDGGQGDLKEEVLELHRLAQQLRQARLRAGALEIVSNEVRFRLDEKGVPLEVYEKVMGEANWLIEEFMLLANRRVAAWVGRRKKGGERPFVYRVHDLPDPEKVDQLRALARSFGYQLQVQHPEELPHAINTLLREIRGKEEEGIIRQVVIRTMAKATYTTDNIGHYGLAFEHYTHFTSPIRRYPDMLVHRALAHYLDHGGPLDKERLEMQCVHSSMMERRAADAERASVRYKQAEYLMARIGEEFDGKVSGITSWGVYVELDSNHCEGMIPVRDMRGDIFKFEEERYRLVGMRSGRTIHLGDPLRVIVRSVDMDRRTVDLRETGGVRRT
ncbi:MAG: ribonuclease R [Flavobacteriales bacterium]|nr:ribonuclease R [Flavobacteriales bacterium]MCB9167069.1 ribonuclease R [Flavobacteriales bacterium]